MWWDTGTTLPGIRLGLYCTLHRRAVWDDGLNAATAMIHRDPTSTMLRGADVITLFDPQIPGWNQVVISFDGEPERHSPDFVVIDIPVDSANECHVLLWRDRIRLARR